MPAFCSIAPPIVAQPLSFTLPTTHLNNNTPPPCPHTDVERSILGDGCIVEPDAKITHSVVGLRSIIREGCVIEDSLLMGADYYEQYEECEALADCLPLGVGKGTHIRGAIVDKNARIGKFCKIVNAEGIQVGLGGRWLHGEMGTGKQPAVVGHGQAHRCDRLPRPLPGVESGEGNLESGVSECPLWITCMTPAALPPLLFPLQQESFKTEEQGWVIRDGVVVVIKDSNIPDGTII